MSANDRVLIMNSDEQQLVVRSLYELRNTLLEIDGPVEDVEDVLMKVIDAPSKRERRRMDRDER